MVSRKSKARKSKSKSKRSRIEIHGINTGSIKSNVGFSPSIPPMLNNSKDIMNAKQNMKKIKNMMVAVTASWCGACHNISDDLNKAIRDPNNTSPGTRIDEKMLDKFNRVLNTPIEPPHFPYFIVIDEQGNLKEVLETMEAVKQFLKSPKPASMTPVNTVPPVNAVSPVSAIVPSYVPSATITTDDAEDEAEEAALSKKFESLSVPSNLSLTKSPSIGTQINSAIRPSPMKIEPVSGIPNAVVKGPSALPPNSTMSGAVPPRAENDAVSPSGTTTATSNQKGGCLYSSIANVAYQLAAPAALFGIAAATLRKKGRKTKKSRKI
jgi:hypothetical protein